MKRASLHKGFWYDRLQTNAQHAIFHQWDQLEASGCIHNFRIAAGEADGWREGWFFADSDAYKWLDAAARIWVSTPDAHLGSLMDDFIALLRRAQTPDGYLYTYNQIHFPTVRWQNLQIEHELYCHGHLIEAAVSHYQATGRQDLLDIARRAADRIVADFLGKGPEATPGHQEIEIALLRLHRVMDGETAYLAMAQQFLEQRGRIHGFGLHILREFKRVNQREKIVQHKKQQYRIEHPDIVPYQLPPGNISKRPPGSTLRWYASALRGQYAQQHTPVREQTVPVGHAVRFGYLETAIAMLACENGDRTLVPVLERAWERMVTRRMYITGGLGSVPGLEGFGADYELDPEFAYAETCAALASLFWNYEMTRLTGEARYSDLFEWQLYNAAAVGMGLDGRTYLYNNPLVCRGGVERKPWYAVPCCPSNLSRTWADLWRYIFSSRPGGLQVNQYVSSTLTHETIGWEDGSTARLSLEMDSGLPWESRTFLKIKQIEFSGPQAAQPLELALRLPSWTTGMSVKVNGETVVEQIAPVADAAAPTASGYDPRPSVFLPLSRSWAPGDEIEVSMQMPVQLRRAHLKVKGHAGKAAVTRGPLVYCLESVDKAGFDNPGVDIFNAALDPATLAPVLDKGLLGGIVKIVGRSRDGAPLTFIPYFLWGNRGPSQMTVWVKV